MPGRYRLRTSLPRSEGAIRQRPCSECPAVRRSTPGVKTRQAKPIDRAVPTHQGSRPAVADRRVILDPLGHDHRSDLTRNKLMNWLEGQHES